MPVIPLIVEDVETVSAGEWFQAYTDWSPSEGDFHLPCGSGGGVIVVEPGTLDLAGGTPVELSAEQVVLGGTALFIIFDFYDVTDTRLPKGAETEIVNNAWVPSGETNWRRFEWASENGYAHAYLSSTVDPVDFPLTVPFDSKAKQIGINVQVWNAPDMASQPLPILSYQCGESGPCPDRPAWPYEEPHIATGGGDGHVLRFS